MILINYTDEEINNNKAQKMYERIQHISCKF